MKASERAEAIVTNTGIDSKYRVFNVDTLKWQISNAINEGIESAMEGERSNSNGPFIRIQRGHCTRHAVAVDIGTDYHCVSKEMSEADANKLCGVLNDILENWK